MLKNKIFTILPVHNNLEFTKKCLTSLSKQTYKEFEVILVDSGSDDNTTSFYKKYYKNWKIVNGHDNWWWTKSISQGVKYALKTANKNDYIMTMNNDCVVKSNYLSEMIECASDNKNSIVGSLIIDAESQQKVLDAGVRIDWKNANIYGVAKMVSNKLSFYVNRNIIDKLDTLPGKGTLIPVKVFDKIGNFNYRKLPHYYGDYEFFCRAKKYGFKLLVNTKARIYNYSKNTGLTHIRKNKTTHTEVLRVLFGKKSKLNIIDHLNFLILCCPKKYLGINLIQVYNKLMVNIVKIPPFYYIHVIIYVSKKMKYKFRVLQHNLPIYFRQNKIIVKIMLLIHNLPIYLHQSITKLKNQDISKK